MNTLGRAALLSLLVSCTGEGAAFRPASAGGSIAAPDGAAAGGSAGDGSTGKSTGGTSGAGGSAAPANARRFRLATTGAQLLVSGPAVGLQLTPAEVTTDADVVGVHQEFYGVPWDALEAGRAPPAEWTRVMNRLALAAADADKPVFLSITMLNGQRERLAATTTIESGQVKTRDDSSERCYDFGTAPDGQSKRAAYLRYVELMVDLFRPAYLNVAVEVNLFFEKCPNAASTLREVINAAYDAAKARSDKMLVFPSFQIDHLYGFSKDSCPEQSARDACFDAAYGALQGLKRDRFAMSSYPYLNGISDAAALPPDWFTRGAARGKERALIAETGWLSTPLVAKARDGTCLGVFAGAEASEADYLARVLADADRAELDLVTWWSDRDLLVESVMTDCPCRLDPTWCSVVDAFRGPATTTGTDTGLFGEILMKAFGTMGLRRYDGTEKSRVYPIWSSALGRPFRP
jgi:hypothetical protein